VWNFQKPSKPTTCSSYSLFPVSLVTHFLPNLYQQLSRSNSLASNSLLHITVSLNAAPFSQSNLTRLSIFTTVNRSTISLFNLRSLTIVFQYTKPSTTSHFPQSYSPTHVVKSESLHTTLQSDFHSHSNFHSTFPSTTGCAITPLFL
jgi:hypothetical protein